MPHANRPTTATWAVTMMCNFTLFASQGAIAQTCTVHASAASPDSNFDNNFTQNGPGQPTPDGEVQEPADIPGWTGGDSTYSIYLPMTGETAFFFSDSYVGQAPPQTGDGTAYTDANGLRTRSINCDTSFGCFPPTNLFRAHNSIVVRNASGTVGRTITGPVVGGYSTSYFMPANAASTGHFYWVAIPF